MYKISIEFDKDGNVTLLHVDKDGIKVEYDPKLYRMWDLIDLINDYDYTVIQGK